MQADSQRLSVREKIGYSLGDAAANFVFRFFIVVGCLFFYRITKKMNIQIQDELAERRKQFQHA